MDATTELHLVGLQEIRKNWCWFLGLGILLIILGFIAVGSATLMTVVSMVYIGWLLILGGVFEVTHAFWKERGWSGFFIDLLAGVLHTVVGFMLVANPAASAMALTLLIAVVLIFSGIFRVIASLSVKHPNWVLVLVHGLVNLLLGIGIWQQWPISGLWVIGLFIGIEMIFNGFSLTMLGMVLRSVPEMTEE